MTSVKEENKSGEAASLKPNMQVSSGFRQASTIKPSSEIEKQNSATSLKTSSQKHEMK